MPEDEARLLTVDEIKELPCNTDLIVEETRLPDPDDQVRPRMYAATLTTKGTAGITMNWEAYSYSKYNNMICGWRLWTRRPSEGRRASVPWADVRK